MKKYLIFVLLLVFVQASIAQETKNSEFYKTIISNDRQLFDVGFNTCNISRFEELLSEDFEFFHDTSGTSNRTEFLTNLKNGLCVSPEKNQSRRELLPESTQIFPLYKNKEQYGAIQNGIHKFYEKIAGKKERFASTAKFTHVWILERGIWKLSRSLSYDHQIPKTEIKGKKK